MAVSLLQKTGVTLQEYVQRLRMFRPNARLYLLSVVMTGAAIGIYRLLFNFFVLSLGYDEALVGKLLTTSQATALLIALPMGYLIDIIGRRRALAARSLLLGTAVAAMALWPSKAIFYLMNVGFGITRCISAVAQAPFLMNNSGEEERTYLFSFSSGLRMGSMFVGSWLGGYLPTWAAQIRGSEPTASEAYALALLAVSAAAAIGFIPLIFLKPALGTSVEQTAKFSPFTFMRKEPKLMAKLLGPMLLISVGAGFFMPFMNVFFRQVHNQPDPVIGTLFAWGSLAMGIGLMIAPPIADRLGKIRLVVITQGLSIPFMILLGFAPVFLFSAAGYYARLTLMNMSNPIYQTFVMEQVEASARSTVASLVSMVMSFGRAFSPTVSGYLQVSYGFGPPFAIAISLYALAVIFYWLFFIHQRDSRRLIV
jgi:MFS family permease